MARWKKSALMSQGGYGSLYYVTPPLFQKRYVLRELDSEENQAQEEQVRARFLREINALKKLAQHNNIIELIDSNTTIETWFLVMEYADGGSLLHYFNELSAQDKKQILPGRVVTAHENNCQLWATQLLTAVVFLHQRGVYHRNIQLKSILLSGGTLKLANFGCATSEEYSSEVHVRPPYMAPELVRQSGATYSAVKIDYYATSVVLSCMLAPIGLFPGMLALFNRFYTKFKSASPEQLLDDTQQGLSHFFPYSELGLSSALASLCHPDHRKRNIQQIVMYMRAHREYSGQAESRAINAQCAAVRLPRERSQKQDSCRFCAIQ